MESRFDSAPVGKARRDARGFLVVPCRPTRTGVFRYVRADGTVIHELRHPDDVFEPASLASLEGASVTELHPNGFVTPENAGQLEIGVSSAGRQDGAYVANELSVRRKDSIGKVERKELVEASCSYTLDVDPTPGVYNGQRYDQRQRNIRYNHVALGPAGWGRGGPEVRVRMDAQAAYLDDDTVTTEFGAADDAPRTGETHVAPASAAPVIRSDQAHGAQGRSDSGTPEKETTMKKIRIDGVEYEVADQVAAAYEAAVSRADGEKARADGLQTQVNQATSRADSALGREDALRAQLTAKETELTTIKAELATANDPAKRNDAVTARVALQVAASKVLGENERFDSLTDRQIREKAILKVNPKAKFEGRSDDYVTAQFDTLIVEGAGRVNVGLVKTQATVELAAKKRADSKEKRDDDEEDGDDLDTRLDDLENVITGKKPKAKKDEE